MNRHLQKATSLGAGALILATAACAGGQGHEPRFEAYLNDKPVEAQGMYETALRQGKHNLALNQLRAGLAAMELGHDEAAAQSFDAAIRVIRTWTFVGVERGTFRGDPYERAMTYYYRGLLHLRAGEYESARASFRSAMLQDTLAADESYPRDFGLLAFLEGWASRCNGDADLARESFAQARALRGDLVEPPAGHDLLVLAETGFGPVKVGAGEYGEQVIFFRGKSVAETSARVRLGDRPSVPMALAADIFWQASSRGGQEIDHVFGGRVSLKDTGRTTHASGFGMPGGKAGDQLASINAPKADTRYWSNLPDSVLLATGRAQASPQRLRVTFLDDGMSEVTGLERVVERTTTGNCSIAWTRSRSAVDVPERAPNSGVNIAQAQ